jgi:hypothetical protein
MTVEACPYCEAYVIRTITIVPAQAFDPVPRQIETHVKITSWQCDRNARHSGEWMEPYDPSQETHGLK